ACRGWCVMTSAYPIAPEVLAEKVRQLAAETGAWPSRNQVMKAFRVGAPKASDALAALRASGFDPTTGTTTPTASRAAEATGVGSETTAEASTRPDLHLVKTPPAEAAEGDTGGDRIAAEPTENPAEGDGPADIAEPIGAAAPDGVSVEVAAVADPGVGRRVRVPRWPILLIALGAFVSIWGGWVGLGELAGFGPVRLLPGIVDEFVINSAITLPLGVEAYAFYALWVWLAPAGAQVPARARRFACWSAMAALGLG